MWRPSPWRLRSADAGARGSWASAGRGTRAPSSSTSPATSTPPARWKRRCPSLSKNSSSDTQVQRRSFYKNSIIIDDFFLLPPFTKDLPHAQSFSARKWPTVVRHIDGNLPPCSKPFNSRLSQLSRRRVPLLFMCFNTPLALRWRARRLGQPAGRDPRRLVHAPHPQECVRGRPHGL